METIRLPHSEWSYDANHTIGRPGGFGAVFAGEDSGFGILAIKRLHLSASEAAHRELRLANDLVGKEYTHVIPIFDAGQDANSEQYFLVMPRAERSLQDELEQRGALDDGDAAAILLQIAIGLSEVSHIVHRDLKPANVLLHDGKWKIADFGIARFVEESTSLHTLKNCLTRAYAAPEQWRMERAVSATDIYALGCIGYALLSGAPPFRGPDFSQQHQLVAPEPLSGHAPPLQSLIAMMLRKPPQSRPSIDRVIAGLRAIESSPSNRIGGGLGALAEVGVSDAAEIARREAEQEKVFASKRSRSEIAGAAFEIFHNVVDNLFVAIENQAPTAHRSQNTGSRRINLGRATLRVDFVGEGKPIAKDTFADAGWDVIAVAGIKVQQIEPACEWGASLWYTNLGDGEQFRWYEVGYFESPLLRPETRQHQHEPFFANPDQANEAHAPVLGRYQVAYGPLAIDDENFTDFANRWAGLLAKSAAGKLRQPSQLPIAEWMLTNP